MDEQMDRHIGGHFTILTEPRLSEDEKYQGVAASIFLYAGV